MISYTVDSSTYGGHILALPAEGYERVVFSEPMTKVRRKKRELLYSDGDGEGAVLALTSEGYEIRVRVLGGGTISGTITPPPVKLNLTEYKAALADLKAKRIALGSSPTADQVSNYKNSAIAADTARDTVMADFKTDLEYVDTESGATYIGRIYRSRLPYPRAVRLYAFDSGELIDTAYPNDEGTFIFINVVAGKYFLTAHDFGTISGSSPIIKTIDII